MKVFSISQGGELCLPTRDAGRVVVVRAKQGVLEELNASWDAGNFPETIVVMKLVGVAEEFFYETDGDFTQILVVNGDVKNYFSEDPEINSSAQVLDLANAVVKVSADTFVDLQTVVLTSGKRKVVRMSGDALITVQLTVRGLLKTYSDFIYGRMIDAK